ncbi:MAG: hypothetical protein FWD98_03795 [Defluviitaleaceae bacterium]|nr:hypothetical protein [Defluviitaleaceae bacterium]
MKITDLITKHDLGEPYDRLSDFLELDEIVRLEQAYNGQQVRFNRQSSNITNEYPELVAAVGVHKAKIVVNVLGDMRIYFPTLRKSAREKIKNLISSEFNGYNFHQLSRKFGYSERHTRHILKGQPRHSLVDKNQLTLSDLL